jgi:hypothetical protein
MIVLYRPLRRAIGDEDEKEPEHHSPLEAEAQH